MREGLEGVRIVLVEPAGARNVGSIARVMKNMGLGQLVIVRPDCEILGAEARQMAVHAADLLEQAKIVPDLTTALEGCHRVAATVGRDGVNRPVESLRSLLPWLLPQLDPPSSLLTSHFSLLTSQTAIVFGREDHGLSNSELNAAHRLITLPSNPCYPSLNLAQAVGICCYELRQAIEEGIPVPNVQNSDQPMISDPAPFELTEAFYQGLESLLLTIGYLYPHTAESRMQKFRWWLMRSQPSRSEVTMLLGILRQLRWALNQSPAFDGDKSKFVKSEDTEESID